MIRLRGGRQNNLQGVDLDLPLGQMIVVTGPSGSGKSSLAFDTLYAEGQRRYIETFSPYTRQFLERMDKPQADLIDGIPPAIAIQQANTIRTTRSTVGTITEINDYLKLLFPRAAVGRCPSCDREVRPETPKSILEDVFKHLAGETVLVTFPIPVPPGTQPTDFFQFLNSQGYMRVLLFGEVVRTDELPGRSRLPGLLPVVQDRLVVDKDRRTRLSEALEQALRLGSGQVGFWLVGKSEMRPYSTGWHCAHCDVDLPRPGPGLFSFNSPLGACPECKGFGRVIGIDWSRVMPDTTLSIAGGVIRPFQTGMSAECQKDLLQAARRRDVDIGCPFEDLPEADRKWVIEGEARPGEDAWQSGLWYGVKGYFDWLESKTYKMHVRVLLSRYRSYGACPACRGGRFRPETSLFRLPPGGLSLPELASLPVRELCRVFEGLTLPANDPGAALLRGQVLSRVKYLEQVGLGYLTLNRPTRTLSGGEVERVNLTACLGASLTSTLFVLDEPSVGLHPRDTSRLVEILHALRDKGNTLVVVEHEEAVIRAADYLVDVGPGRGRDGGRIAFAGPAEKLPSGDSPSLTRDYLTGKKEIPVPRKRRKPSGWVKMRGIRHHNLKNVSADFPLGVLCCVTGVSGSGKSSLVHGVLYPNLSAEPATEESDTGQCRSITGDEDITDVVMVDQSPLGRSPRSTPAVYVGAYDKIRELFGTLPEALGAGLSPTSFSFNSGDGRCGRCGGLGFEKIEMQFLSDVFLRCPECEGRRFQDHVLEVKWKGYSVADVLGMTVEEAVRAFAGHAGITGPLQILDDVGLGYLKLGQPVNELSGGESQRLKLAGHLSSRRDPGALLIFDEPTTGLHFDDIARLLAVFRRLVDEGDHLIVIEHNLEVIKCADWVIDLGPEAGDEGGKIVATGTPEAVAATESLTGKYLAEALKGGRKFAANRPVRSRAAGPGNAIKIRGAREHNLKNIDIDIPRGKTVVVTGLSGSGKSTLAFDILFAEGQRRFLDSMSAYARQFVEQLEKPDVDSIEGLPPSVAIEQRVTRGGGKSTVATVTEVYHFLRLLFAKLGTQYCPKCQEPVVSRSESEVTSTVAKLAKKGPVRLFAPLVKGRKGFHSKVARWAARQGIETLRVDGSLGAVDAFRNLERFKEHTIEAFVGRVEAGSKETPELVRKALEWGKGSACVLDDAGVTSVLSTAMNCPGCGQAFEPLDPRLFSFNSPHGWCGHCRGFGVVWKSSSTKEFETELEAELAEERCHENLEDGEATPCPICRGARINENARNVHVGNLTVPDIVSTSANRAARMLESLHFDGSLAKISRDIVGEIRRRLDFLQKVGLDYLSLDRAANTLSGGESQRIRLAAQLGSNLRGVLYVLDEPTIGLHARDNARLLDALGELAVGGNTLVIVEHDEETMRRADHLIDLGPGAGSDGGSVMAEGTFKEVVGNPKSVTARALRSPMVHPSRGQRRPLKGHKGSAWIRIRGAHLHNLQNVDADFPVNRLTVVTGLSGSGKSSLVRGVLDPGVRKAITRSSRIFADIPCREVFGVEEIGGVLVVDQSPIGKTSRSTPATYVKVLDTIRNLYADLPASRMRGYSASRFSFNNEGGRCEACLGQGVIKLEMNFLPPAYMPCEECGGSRFNRPTLEVEYNGKSIGDTLAMTAQEAASFFSAHPKIRRPLELLVETGLGYLQLGQPSPTLSGGEAQRIKLVTQVARRATRKAEEVRTTRRGKSTLYILEEPTIGLHSNDVTKLVGVLHRLVDEGGTVVVVEHHMDIIAEADYVIDLGPEAGESGGQIMAVGTPEEVAQSKKSHTAPFLREILQPNR
ncbi:MAG: excinuclease ABC subunit UvrA [Terrimicrobiaceae bacterium]